MCEFSITGYHWAAAPTPCHRTARRQCSAARRPLREGSARHDKGQSSSKVEGASWGGSSSGFRAHLFSLRANSTDTMIFLHLYGELFHLLILCHSICLEGAALPPDGARRKAAPRRRNAIRWSSRTCRRPECLRHLRPHPVHRLMAHERLQPEISQEAYWFTCASLQLRS